jgi:hypothetical protein
MFARWRKIVLWLFVVALVAAATAVGYHKYFTKAAPQPQYQTAAEADPYVRFDMEAYDAITANYWMTPGQYAKFGLPELPTLFQMAVKQMSGTDAPLATTTRTAVAQMIDKAFAAATSTDERRQWALGAVSLVINTLLPAGRNQVLSNKQEVALRQEVSNIKPADDLYGNLGLPKGASTAQVDTAYKQKAAALAQATSSQAKAELQQVSYAHQVLADQSRKALYDQAQIQPTVFAHVYGSTLYLYIEQIAPTTLQEFGRALDAASTTPLDSLVLDLRGNIGGALDFAPAFVGLFIGANQYAFDFYHQGDYTPVRTTLSQFDELARYKDNVVILTDNMTQSTAEVTTAALKRYNLAQVVGGTTRGWGTVENTYPLDVPIDPGATYALLLVNNLTLRDDNAPIEGAGVVPTISSTATNWRTLVDRLFASQSLAQTVLSRVTQPPVK